MKCAEPPSGALARIKPGDKRRATENYILPTADCELGTADRWLPTTHVPRGLRPSRAVITLGKLICCEYLNQDVGKGTHDRNRD